MKIISGGQIGVDQAALQAAYDHHMQIGGWCAPGYIKETDFALGSFLRETPRERSAKAPAVPRSLRTEWNVRDADATLLLIATDFQLDAGTQWTLQCVKILKKPQLQADPFEAKSPGLLISWLKQLQPTILNIAGPKEKDVPGIYNESFSLLSAVFGSLSKKK